MRQLLLILLALASLTQLAAAQDIPEIWPAEALSRDMSIVPRELLVDGLYQAPASFYFVELKAYSAGVPIWQDDLRFDSLSAGRINELGPLEFNATLKRDENRPQRLACFKPDGAEELEIEPSPVPDLNNLRLPQLGIGSIRLDCVSEEGAEQLRFNGVDCLMRIDGADEIEITIWQCENSSSSPEAFFMDHELLTPEANHELWTGPEFDQDDPAWTRIVSYRARHKPALQTASGFSSAWDLLNHRSGP
jgi:hypothetical protein